ncbi:MAG: hypothetical protein PHR06_11655 [Candidatus Cloacimonetes bacterium]|nr:hypothetical protein [Candidatus Cloacimonadota bacterium]
MGQQQILLIVLSVILVGLAIAIGISMIREKYTQGLMDDLAWQLIDAANLAYRNYKLPASLGGSENNYDKVVANKSSWMPSLMYAIEVSVDTEESGSDMLVFSATIPDGSRTATLTLDETGSTNLTWVKN